MPSSAPSAPSVQQMTRGVALRVGPADPGIPRAQMEGGAGPTQQGNPLASLLGDEAERFADQAVFFEIVMFTDQSIPLRFLLRGG